MSNSHQYRQARRSLELGARGIVVGNQVWGGVAKLRSNEFQAIFEGSRTNQRNHRKADYEGPMPL